MTTLTSMSAEVCFCNPDDLSSAMPDLIDARYDITELDWIDDDGSAVWIIATLRTGLDELGFMGRLSRVVERHGGSVIEAGPTELVQRGVIERAQ